MSIWSDTLLKALERRSREMEAKIEQLQKDVVELRDKQPVLPEPSVIRRKREWKNAN